VTIVYQNGIGDTLGSVLSTCRPLYSTGNVWYVNSNGGVDAASPAGQNREKPLATLVQAVTNATDFDIIDLMPGHAETLAAQLTISKVLTIVGGGRSGGLPTVKIGLAPEAGTAIAVDTSFVELINVWMLANPGVNTNPRIDVGAEGFNMADCYVECGPNDHASAVRFSAGSDSSRIANTTFISTATSVAAQPTSAVEIAATLTRLTLDGLVLSAGTAGFSNYRAFDGAGFSIAAIRGLSVSLLLGADMKLHPDTTGYVNVQTCTGGSRLDW